MASLNTFGAIITYAIQIETALRDYYQAMGSAERAKESDSRRAKLERVRRENVVEITLEPIEGLDEADYALDLTENTAEAQATAEATAARFYADVAPKINVRQAQRALERCQKQHEELAG